jgi:ketopantoate hydroxymethyltransferase
MKTLNDYMNDPRIQSDPDMGAALEPVKQIHAIRLKLQDERAGMTAAEEIAYLNKRGKDFLAHLGLRPQLVNLSGQGKLAPR